MRFLVALRGSALVAVRAFELAGANDRPGIGVTLGLAVLAMVAPSSRPLQRLSLALWVFAFAACAMS